MREDKEHAPIAVAVDDVNCDGHLAIVALYEETGETRVETSYVKDGVPIEPITVPGKYTLVKLANLDFDFGKNIKPPDLGLVLAGPSGIRVLENYLEDGKRRWLDHTDDLDLPPLQGVRELLVLDLDDDGMLDIVARLDKRMVILRNLGRWRFAETPPWSAALDRLHSESADFKPSDWTADARVLATGSIDYDNDGQLDAWVWTDDVKKPLRLFHNDGGKFTETTNLLPPLPQITSSPVVVDLDGDGGLDFVFTTTNGVGYLMNHGADKNHWLDIRLQSTNIMDMAGGNALLSNFSGIGTIVELRSGRHVQRQVARGGTIHFGLGQIELVDTVRIVWSNGTTQALIHPEIDRLIDVKQRMK